LFPRGITAVDTANGDDPKHLLTVHGVGYKLVL
jgi:hypothetical protein